ncbi:MAG TPA: hypothetical protein PK970_08190 [Hyphomicrobiaceae bacterium]|mgnify:CR=1 FL=1|nr:hypothetical protein [Hyphomicrobiaceae bacterium]
MLFRAFFVLALSMFAAAVRVSAAELPRPELYAEKCGNCHYENGADMASLKMSFKGSGIIVNSTGKSVDALLKKHHGVKLTAAEATELMELFRRGLSWESVYRQKCESCHGVAITFARSELSMVDGVAFAPKRNATVRDVLAAHGGATTEEADVLADMIRYQIGIGTKAP